MKPPYLQLPGGHLEGQLGDAASGPASSVGGMQLIPDGIAVHLEARGSVRWGQGTSRGDLGCGTHARYLLYLILLFNQTSWFDQDHVKG